MLEIII